MHKLPFGASITDRLFQMVRNLTATKYQAEGFVPGFEFEIVSDEVRWVLTWLINGAIPPERLFLVDGVWFYMSKTAQSQAHDRVFDWSETEGLVAYAGAA
jgi:hypothetical protein